MLDKDKTADRIAGFVLTSGCLVVIISWILVMLLMLWQWECSRFLLKLLVVIAIMIGASSLYARIGESKA